MSIAEWWSVTAKRRSLAYVILAGVLLLAFVALSNVTRLGNIRLHVRMEIVITMLALFAGTVALVRFYSKKNNTFLFIGTGFIGASVLDGYHVIASSLYFSEQFPTAFPSLVAWSWLASRLFLSLMLGLSVLAWRQEKRLGEKGRVAERTVYLVSIVLGVLSFFLFALVPLPRSYYGGLAIHRPFELIPALIFLLALYGYWKKGEWRQNDFEHWLMLSLVISVACQVPFMSQSARIFDVFFDAAHMLKALSYTAVLTGLVISMYNLFRQADESKREVIRANTALREEINERRRVQQELEERTATVQVLRDVADAANRAGSIRDAMQYTVERVCEYIEWSIGHAYILDDRGDDTMPALTSLSVWYLGDVERFDAFRCATEETDFAAGVGLPGKVLATGAPHWIAGVADTEGFLRADVAEDAGVQTGFAIPVIVGDNVVAVLEFFTDQHLERNESLLDILGHVGTQLGRVIERKQAEKNLRTSEARFRAVAESANEAIISADLEGNIIFWNEGAETLFGYTREEMLQNSMTRIMPERYVEVYDWGIGHMRSTGQNRLIGRTVEMHGLGKERGEFPIELSLATWEAGDEQYVTAIIRDVTQRKEMENELRKNQMQLAEAQRIAHIGSWEWDIESDTVTWSDELHRIYGLSPDQFDETYEEFLDRVHPDDRERAVEQIQHAYENQESFSYEHRIVRPDGTVRNLQARGRVIVDDDGKPVRMIGTGQDITERKRAEEELKRFAARLEQSNRELEQFAYVASHDLQEPLRKIAAFGSRLQSKYADELDDVGQDYIRRMHNAAERMQMLVEDLLMLSRVTTRGKPFEPVDLTEIVNDVVSDVEIRLDETNGRVDIGELATIEADPVQMRQLLQNLITNAIKFRRDDEPPIIDVYGAPAPENTDDLDVEFEREMYRIIVSDNGIGFDQKYIEKIFQPFQRLHGRGTYEGTGMGLAICRRIVERHNGRITASSEDGHGATFTIWLPLTQQQENGQYESAEPTDHDIGSR